MKDKITLNLSVETKAVFDKLSEIMGTEINQEGRTTYIRKIAKSKLVAKLLTHTLLESDKDLASLIKKTKEEVDFEKEVAKHKFTQEEIKEFLEWKKQKKNN